MKEALITANLVGLAAQRDLLSHDLKTKTSAGR